MTRRLIGCALAAAFLCAPLGACVTRPATPAEALTPAQVAQRAMLAAETAFNVAATAELDAKAMGILKGAQAVRADQVRKDAYTTLLGLRAVYAAGQTPDATSLLILTNQLLALAGKPPVVVPTVPTI